MTNHLKHAWHSCLFPCHGCGMWLMSVPFYSKSGILSGMRLFNMCVHYSNKLVSKQTMSLYAFFIFSFIPRHRTKTIRHACMLLPIIVCVLHASCMHFLCYPYLYLHLTFSCVHIILLYIHPFSARTISGFPCEWLSPYGILHNM